MTPNLVFLHIEKAAGSSLRNLFYDNFGTERVFWHGIDDETIIDQYSIIGGHRGIGFYLSKKMPAPPIYLAVMREPISRVVSFYAHLKRHTNYFTENPASSFKDAILNCEPFRKHITSGQVSYILGKSKFSEFESDHQKHTYVIGTMEYLNSFTKLISEKLLFQNTVLKKVNLGLSGYKEEIDIDDEVFSELEKLLREDIKLHKCILEQYSGLYNNSSDGDWSPLRKLLLELKYPENKSFEGSCRFANPKSIPKTIATGEAFSFPVVLSNNSKSLWTAKGGSINLSYHWINSENHTIEIFEGIRTPINDIQLEPGEAITQRMQAMTPKNEGSYLLKIVPIKTKHAWFDKYNFDSDSKLICVKN